MQNVPSQLLDNYPINPRKFENMRSSSQPTRNNFYQKCGRGSHSSDTSSAYSGSDTMATSEVGDEMDMNGLAESIIDSDEEDITENMDPGSTVRDRIRDCLEKDPPERTEEDVDTLLEFTQHLKAFSNMTLAVRRSLCSVMVFAVVEKAGTVVMNHNEELDSWSVLVNGCVDVIIPGKETQTLCMGEAFGILPTMDKFYHVGEMVTKCDDCQFVCITQSDYYRILHQGEENIRRHEEDGKLVMVTEIRNIYEPSNFNRRSGHIVIRATPNRLMLQLVEENSITDPTFVEDFLLTYRTFMPSAVHVADQLFSWFTDVKIRDRVTRVVLLWVNNHFTDFEMDAQMMDFLERFERELETEKMMGQLRLLNIACTAKARKRVVVLTRSSREEPLNFKIHGGYDRNFGIFILTVDRKTKAEEIGLKRADQILEVNGQSFEHVTLARAMEILRSTTHLSITVKSNLLHFKEMLQTPGNSPRPRTKKTTDISKLQNDPRARLSTGTLLDGGIHGGSYRVHMIKLDGGVVDDDGSSSNSVNSLGSAGSSTNSPLKDPVSHKKSSFMTMGPKKRLQKALMKMNIFPKNIINLGVGLDTVDSINTKSNLTSSLYHSQSNPDLVYSYYDDLQGSDYPEHVLKVYKPDQSYKYLLVHKETTAHEVVMLALQEFGMTDPSSNFSLCEVSVTDTQTIKQKRLPDQLQNLAERIELNSRYYLKTNGITETLVPDELAPELLRDSAVHFLQLNAVEIAIQLTLIDFSIFQQIEPTEYIDDLFEIKSKYGTPMLDQFAALVNKEMFWVVTEVCSEHNPVRRMKIIKQFIKVARQCKECKNFNSMFAIISGLGHGAVSRLRQSWEKLPSKYLRLFNDLQLLMDPSRNMSKYRQLVSTEQSQPPIIPFYPVAKKDLTFIHLGNDSEIDGLINFEKLRMIAKEVRALGNMCSSPYDLLTMLQLGGQPTSNAMVALNQLTTAHHCNQGQATVKRRKKPSVAPNPRKMFEESQMVRRVKAYLNNLNVVRDESRLHEMSLDCESAGSTGSASLGAGGSTGSGSNTQLNTATAATATSNARSKRNSSPAPSTTSSTSSASEERKPIAKFGSASPQAVKKLLSLSEVNKTKPHQPRQPHPAHHIQHHFNYAVPPHAHHYHTPHPLHHMTQMPNIPAATLPNAFAHPMIMRRTPSATGVCTSYCNHGAINMPMIGRSGVHERSHSDTPTPLPSVALSAESSSVTSLSNMPLRKNVISGSVTSSDSGHSMLSRCTTDSSEGATTNYSQCYLSSRSSSPPRYPPPPLPGRRPPPAYAVAAQMSRLTRLGRAHSHEGVTQSFDGYNYYIDPDRGDEDDEETQVSAV